MAKARSRRQKRIQVERLEHAEALRQRLRYVCALHYGGNAYAMARDMGVHGTSLSVTMFHDYVPRLTFLLRLARSGVVNAEWLLCGTGPISGEGPDTPRLVDVPPFLCAAHATFDPADVQYRPHAVTKVPAAKLSTPEVAIGAISLARAVHAARVAHRPVLLYLDANAVQDGASAIAAELLRKGYVTGIACSSAAAQADLAQVIYGGNLDTFFVPQLDGLQRAAYLAAAQGTGYGEALGRWGYPVSDRRGDSFIATAYELKCPITIHAQLGEAAYHLFPAKGGAEFGAALGAASYADLRIFAAQVRQCCEHPGGVFIAVERDTAGALLFQNTRDAVATSDDAPDAKIARGRLSPFSQDDYDNDYFISGEPRLTLPALLNACDAVYDGSADDARSSRRTRNYRVKRNR